MMNQKNQNEQKPHFLAFIPPVVWFFAIILFCAFTLICAFTVGYFHHSSWSDFAAAEVTTFLTVLKVAGVFITIAIVARTAQYIYTVYHTGVIDNYQRKAAKYKTQKLDLQNETLRVKNRILAKIPEAMDKAMEQGLNVEYEAFKATSYLSNIHTWNAMEEKPIIPALGLGRSLHIPTFAESMDAGEIGVNQKDMLFCYELALNEQGSQAIELNPVRGEMGMLHTQFIGGGSQSGKTTYMSGIVGQSVAMKTLLYIIDPHKNHPEKSIASKVQAFSSYFILPPAGTHEEIAKLLAHATMTRDALIQEKPTPYQGYHIMVVVDEVPALMAYQRSQDKQIKNLYISLALFMQSIGTQTAKFGMTGLFGSQFITKDELGAIEIRDACMSQLMLRLHPTQAQAMRILGKPAMQEIPTLDKGHGFLMLSNSFEPTRVASGNVTQDDLARLASQLPPSPLVSKTAPSESKDSESEPEPARAYQEAPNLKTHKLVEGTSQPVALEQAFHQDGEKLRGSLLQVYQAIQALKTTNRRAIAYRTGLSLGTVQGLIQQLIRRGYVQE